MAGHPPWVPVFEILVVLALLATAVTVRWADREYDLDQKRRERLLHGIPWGTLVSITGVLLVYLFIQGGIEHWRRPTTIPFHAWSYFYPTGMLLSAFSHSSAGHITGNLISALVLGSLAEYAWGHYTDTQPNPHPARFTDSLRYNPYGRAFVVFPAGVITIGLLTAVLGWGPLIGFSGVVFAFAGFALIRYPILTIVALEGRRFVFILYQSITDPVVIAQVEPQLVRPGWAGVAIQAHLLGLFLGIVAAALVLKHEDLRPARLFVASVIVMTSLSIWAVWWFRGSETFVLYRGPGIVLVLILALLVTLGLYATISPDIVPRLNVPLRTVGLLALLFPVLVVGFAAVPLNLATIDDPTPPGETVITVQDYHITYAENVTDQHVSAIDLTLFGETTQVQRSGVIVISQDRHLWTPAVSRSQLAFHGTRPVRVGGIGWSETVWAQRQGWKAAGNGTAYTIRLRPPDGDWEFAFASDPVTAEPTLRGHRVAIEPTPDGFFLNVTHDQTQVGFVEIPAHNETVTVNDISFVRENDRLFAEFDDTRVRIATRETYN